MQFKGKKILVLGLAKSGYAACKTSTFSLVQMSQ